jgi:hypothetical protein
LVRSDEVVALFAAASLHQDVEHAVRSAMGPHEHEVLEQMREPGTALRLVFRAHVVPEVHGDGRQPAIFVKDHCEAVVETVFLEGNRDSLGVGHEGQ